jgi:hypothetical protein
MALLSGSISLSVAGIDCGSHAAVDLEAIAMLLKMAAKVAAAGGSGRIFCCEPERLRETNPIAQVLIYNDVYAPGDTSVPPVGSVVVNGRKFTYRLEASNNPTFHTCARCGVTTCAAHWSGQLAEAG